MEYDSNKKPKINLLIPILLAITAAAVCITVWAIFFRDTGPVLAPDYAPQQEEENAEAIPGDNAEKMETPEGGSAVSISYSKEVKISLSDETASLYFANPGKSNQDMVLQISIQDEVVVQSGTIKPGNQVSQLKLLNDEAGKLSPGGYDGKFIILYYDPDTGEKAVVNTEIPVTITVNE